MQPQFVPFRPALSGLYADRFSHRTKELSDNIEESINKIEDIVVNELAWTDQQQLSRFS